MLHKMQQIDKENASNGEKKTNATQTKYRSHKAKNKTPNTLCPDKKCPPPKKKQQLKVTTWLHDN